LAAPTAPQHEPVDVTCLNTGWLVGAACALAPGLCLHASLHAVQRTHGIIHTSHTCNDPLRYLQRPIAPPTMTHCPTCNDPVRHLVHACDGVGPIQGQPCTDHLWWPWSRPQTALHRAPVMAWVPSKDSLAPHTCDDLGLVRRQLAPQAAFLAVDVHQRFQLLPPACSPRSVRHRAAGCVHDHHRVRMRRPRGQRGCCRGCSTKNRV